MDEIPAASTWNPEPPGRTSYVPSRSSRIGGLPLFAAPGSVKSTIIEGNGRFVGESSAEQAGSPSGAAKDGVTLNLVDVPAPQAAKSVLGDIFAVNYTIDPTIQGKVTIQTPRPVSKSAVLDLFQSALRADNAALVSEGGIYRIVPHDRATVGARMQVEGSTESGEQIGSGLQVVQLKYVAASEIRRVLEPIAPHGGIVRVDDARHLITLSGTRQDIAAMRDAISLFDVDVMKGMSFALVPVKMSQPDAIAGELRTVFGADRDGPMAGMVKFLPNRRLNAILVISPQPQYLRRAETWIRRLDAQAQGSERQIYTYTVQNRRVQELVDVLQSMFSNEAGGAAGTSASRNVAPNYQEARVQSAAVSQSSGHTSGFSNVGLGGRSGVGNSGPPVSASAAAAVAPSLGLTAQSVGASAVDSSRIKIAADEAENTLLIEANSKDYRRVLKAIIRLDQMPKQVLIEATIAEVTLNDELKFGVRWFLQHHDSSATFTDALSGAVSSVFPGFSYALTAANVTATLNALNGVTKVDVVSSPSLTVRDNKTALLQIGDQVPISTQSATSVLAAGAPVVNSVSYKDTGVILSITPRINKSGRVLLDIEQEVSTVVPTTTSGIDSPTIRQRRIKTSVAVNDGDALMLGGMMQESRTKTNDQIPILGDIPFFGTAARHRDDQMNKTELIIVITPHVIRDLYEARRVTDEYRQQFVERVLGDRKRTHNINHTVHRIVD